MDTNDVRTTYPVEAENGAAAAPAAPSSPLQNRNGVARRRDVGVARRMVAYRRRRQWALWKPFGIAACGLVAGGACPYYRDGKGCPDYRQWSKDAPDAVPPCFAEKRSLLALSDSLTASGWPNALATLVASAMVRGARDGDTRLHEAALKTTTGIGIELVRAASRRAGGGAGGESTEASECLRGLLETGARQ